MAGASAAAAAEAARQQQLEEEMTTYSSEELAKDWEFKIVRANTGIFRNPAELEKLLQEEAQAGWVMVEKFDNSRVRFKRPRSARENDYRLPTGMDPYRTHYGMHPALFVVILLVVILGGTFIAIGVCGATMALIANTGLIR